MLYRLILSLLSDLRIIQVARHTVQIQDMYLEVIVLLVTLLQIDEIQSLYTPEIHLLYVHCSLSFLQALQLSL